MEVLIIIGLISGWAYHFNKYKGLNMDINQLLTKLQSESDLYQRETGFSDSEQNYVQMGKSNDGRNIYMVNKRYLDVMTYTGLYFDIDGRVESGEKEGISSVFM